MIVHMLQWDYCYIFVKTIRSVVRKRMTLKIPCIYYTKTKQFNYQLAAISITINDQQRTFSDKCCKLQYTLCLRKKRHLFNPFTLLICYSLVRCHPSLPILGRNILQEI